MENLIKYIVIFCTFFSLYSLPAKAEIEIVAAEIPPYVFSEGKEVRGLVAEIVQAMAKYTNHSGHITLVPWKRALKLAEEPYDGVARLIIPLNRSKAREPKFKWIKRIYLDRTSLVTLKDKAPLIQNPKEATNWTTGVLLGSPLEQQLIKLQYKKLDPAIDELTNAKKLQAGRIRVWHVARMVAPFVWKQLSLDSSQLQFGASLDANDLYLAGTLNLDESLVKLWQEAFVRIQKNGEMAKIVEKYAK